MKRLIEYYESTKDQMGASQRLYFEILFKRNLFETHYLLSLVWDKDKARGCKRAREFDEFLRAADADFYEYCGKQYQAVASASPQGWGRLGLCRQGCIIPVEAGGKMTSETMPA